MATAPKMKPAKTAGKQRAPKLDESASDRLTREETVDVLKEIQRHFVIRISAVIDYEIDLLRIGELGGGHLGAEVTHDASASIAKFQEAVAIADQQYAGDCAPRRRGEEITM